MSSYRTNTKRRFGEANHYHFIRHEGEWYALTDHDKTMARARALNNVEDWPKLSWFARFLEWLR